MKKNHPNQFTELAGNVPARKVEPYQVKPFYSTSESQLGKAMLAGLLIGAIVFGGFVYLIMRSPRVRCDVNGDGKVTATDLVLVKRAILQTEAGS